MQIRSNVKDNLIRKPYYGRFSPAGLPGGAFFEFRLIDTHLYYGSSRAVDTSRRIDEFLTLSNEVFTRINKKTIEWNTEHPDEQKPLYSEDRIVADKVYAELMKKADEASAANMAKLTGGMGMGGGFPF